MKNEIPESLSFIWGQVNGEPPQSWFPVFNKHFTHSLSQFLDCIGLFGKFHSKREFKILGLLILTNFQFKLSTISVYPENLRKCLPFIFQ